MDDWRAFGDVLRQLREAAGISLRALARAIPFDNGTLSRIERGERKPPSEDVVRLIDRELKASGRLVRLAAEIAAQTLTSRARAMAGASDDDLAMPAAVIEESALAASALLRWQEAENVGDSTLDDMWGELQDACQKYLKEPTFPIFMKVQATREEAAELLRGRQNIDRRRNLAGIAGWASTILGWMTVDLGRPDFADKHLRAAWAFASDAEDDGLRAWVKAAQHTAAFWVQDYERAAKRAAEGLRYATTGTAQLYLLSAFAVDRARLGDTDNAKSALGEAFRVAEHANTAIFADAFSGPFSCSVDRAASLWSDTYLSSGQAMLSLEHSTASVARFEATPHQRRNSGSERMARCQQVKACLVIGDYDSAAKFLAPVIDTKPEHRAHPLVWRVEEIGQAVQRLALPSRKLNETRDALAAFRESSATEMREEAGS